MYYDQHVCGARIQELRKSKGYTQEALAEAIDIDAKRISKIERGVISASYNDMILFSKYITDRTSLRLHAMMPNRGEAESQQQMSDCNRRWCKSLSGTMILP